VPEKEACDCRVTFTGITQAQAEGSVFKIFFHNKINDHLAGSAYISDVIIKEPASTRFVLGGKLDLRFGLLSMKACLISATMYCIM